MNIEEYDKFKEECHEHLCGLQEKLKTEYQIGTYERWDYDQHTGLLTFSTGDNQINFRYVSVGTYSRNTKTWKWAWDNEHTLEKVKGKIPEIKTFGEKHNIKELVTGLIDADEEDGWYFTGIAANLLKGIGSYRAVSDHLLVFMVLMEYVDNETAQEIKDKFIECSEHGTDRAAFICQHLNTIDKVGFNESIPSDPNDIDPEEEYQAWCNACEKRRLKSGEWTDEAMEFANIKLVCNACYFEIKQANQN